MDMEIDLKFDMNEITKKGIIMAISISKIKNRMVIIKKWILKGLRELDLFLNPHSKGDIFSRFLIFFFEIKIEISENSREIIIIIRTRMLMLIIYTKKLLVFLIGS